MSSVIITIQITALRQHCNVSRDCRSQVFHLSPVCITEQLDEREKQVVEDLPIQPAFIYISSNARVIEHPLLDSLHGVQYAHIDHTI